MSIKQMPYIGDAEDDVKKRLNTTGIDACNEVCRNQIENPKVQPVGNKVNDTAERPAMRWRRFIATVLIISLLCTLVGCIEDYTQNDVRDYIIKKYGFDNFTVSEQTEEIVGNDGYTDILWTVTIDAEEKIVFHVQDNRFWGLESVTNTLFTDYEAVMLRYYAERYDGFEHFKLDIGSDDGMEWNEIRASYTDRQSLYDRFDELSAFREFVNAEGFERELAMRYSLKFNNPIRCNVLADKHDYVVEDGDYSGFVTSFDDDTRRLIEQAYLSTCIDYRFENHLSEYSEQEIKAAVQRDRHQIGISRDGGDNYVYYDDLLASKYSYGISFGSLFEILKREGFTVEGKPSRYSFIDDSGNEYQFSYDYVKLNPDEYEHDLHYYYLKNGETVWMRAYFYNHLRASEIEKITGLKLSQYREDD